MLGFGTAAALFLPGVAFLAFTNGDRFIENAFFAAMYGVFSTGFAAVPLLAWRRSDGRHTDPGFFKASWLPWLFTTMQGVAYSSPRSDANVFLLIFGWGMFIYAGTVALYFLGNALWGIDDHRAAPSPSGTAPETPAAGFLRPQAADTSAHAERADRPTSGNRTRSGHGAGFSLRPAEAGSPCCYEAWLDGAPYFEEAFTDQEQRAWADALAEEVRTAYPGVCLDLGIDQGPYLVLFWIRLPENERGNGLGTRVMEHLIAAADLRGVPITLSPSDKFGGNVDRLHAFYRRLGFFANTRRGKFNAARESMVRVPRNFAAAAKNPAHSGSCCEKSTS